MSVLIATVFFNDHLGATTTKLTAAQLLVCPFFSKTRVDVNIGNDSTGRELASAISSPDRLKTMSLFLKLVSPALVEQWALT